LINNGGHLASALHLEIYGATMVRKRVIDEPQNLNHNVVPKRAEIGQITADNGANRLILEEHAARANCLTGYLS